MSQQNAMAILGVKDVTNQSVLDKAYKERVSEIVQKNYPIEQFKNSMDQLFTSYHILSERIKNEERCKKLTNYLTSMHQQNDNMNGQIINAGSKNYKFTKSYSRTIQYDKDGNAIGKTNKVVQENDKIYREEKEFDTRNGMVKVKKYKPDGTIQEFEKPIRKKIEMI